MQQGKFAVPSPSAGDRVHALTKAGIASIPYVGNAGVELFAQIVAPPLERRRDKWMAEVGEALLKLETEKRITPESLSADEAFIDTLIQASQAATRTSEVDKRLALRNAVLNSALPHAPSETKRQLFLRLIDSLPVWSLRMLRLFADPLRWYAEHDKEPRKFGFTSCLEDVLLHAYPELQGEQPLYDQLWRGLYSEGLVGNDSLRVMMSADGAYERRATELGNALLVFVNDPLDSKE